MDETLHEPRLSIALELPADSNHIEKLSALPRRAGVFALHDADGRTLALATTSDLRRAAAAKLASIQPAGAATSIHAEFVGSSFQADWVYLHHARLCFPQSYRGLLDRWQAWFIECDPTAAHPQFTKTPHSTPADPPATKLYLGPFPDKHAAWRYIEGLQGAFDLCRYHHILVQAPHGVACAYKEMGRCPAPCDGSVTMDSYKSQIEQAIDFAGTPFDSWCRHVDQSMRTAAAVRDFEQAQRLRTRLLQTQFASKSEFAFVDRLERFQFIAVMKSDRRNHARLFVVLGGSIQTLPDISLRVDSTEIDNLLVQCRSLAAAGPPDFSTHGIENLGMICWHLFRPKRTKSAGRFLRIDDNLTAPLLADAIAQILTPSKEEASDAPQVTDQEMEELPPS